MSSETKTSTGIELTEKKPSDVQNNSDSCPPGQKKQPKFGIDGLALKGMIGTRDNKDPDDPDVYEYVNTIAKLGGVPGMMHKLGTDIDGIETSSLVARAEAFGENKIPDRRLKTFCELIFEALQDFTLILLLVSGTTQLLLAYIPATASSCDVYPSTHAWVEPFAIYMAVVVVCLVAAGTDYAKQQQMKEQQAKKNRMSKYNVRRSGKTVECQKTALLVGDIIDLDIGAIVPADAYFLKGKNLALDESALTGEPHLMNKSVDKPWLLSGTQVKNGTGTVMICAVGPLSVSGEITMQVLGLSEDDLDNEEEYCMDEFLLSQCSCFVKPEEADPRTTINTQATIVEVRGKGKKASYTVEYSGENEEFLNVKKYADRVKFDQIQEIMDNEAQAEADKNDDDDEDDEDDDEKSLHQTETLAVGFQCNVRAHKTVHDAEEEEVSGLEQKLEDMAGAITGFGFLLACISMVFASIIWAILKFGLGMTTAIPAGASESGYIVDASFWAASQCSDPSLKACYTYHTTGDASLVGLVKPSHRMLIEQDITVFAEGADFCSGFYGNNGTTPTLGCQDFGAKFDPQKIVRILITGITILVVAIPEGLPLAVTLAIAFAQRKLFELDNFVKTLDSCETMGSATTICSDKTGTLTQNRMTAMNVHLGNKTYKGTIERHVGLQLKELSDVDSAVTTLLAHTCAINSMDASQLVSQEEMHRTSIATFEQQTYASSNSELTEDAYEKKRQQNILNSQEKLAKALTMDQPKIQNGNKTECGLLGMVEAMGEDYNQIRGDAAYSAVDGLEWGRNSVTGKGKGNQPAFPFSSSRKRMSWLVPHGNDQLRMHTKGASEVVLQRCTKYLDADNTVKELTDEVRQNMDKTIDAYANAGQRTIGLAYRDFDKTVDLKENWVDPNAAAVVASSDNKKSAKVEDFAVEHDLILIAIVGIEDPLRKGVKEAIAKCFTAGVDVRMVTGDNLNTAIAISTNANILREEHFNHVFDNEASFAKHQKYFDLLEIKHMATVDILKEMKTDRKSDEEQQAFLEACVKCRGIMINGVIDLDPAKYVRQNFAMEGKEFAKRVYHAQTTAQAPGEAPNVSYAGTEYEKKVRPGHVNQEELDKIWPKLRVMARCQPQDKLTLVKGLMDSKLYSMEDKVTMLKEVEGISIYPDTQVVAVTGDGTNDAPALKAASVGFAMGIEGTEVAQDAANVILLSDNFADIVVAMKWGRNIYDSIQKFIQFQLTVNIVACVLACIGAVLFQESPLGAVQMLWVNLVMDSLASLALATEPPTEDLLDRQPYGVHESIIKRGMWINMIGQSSYQLMITLIILFKGHILFFDPLGEVASAAEMNEVQLAIFDDADQLRIGWFAGCDASQHYTLLFHAFVMMTLFNQIAARKLKGEMNLFEGVCNNWIFVFLVGVETLCQVCLVQFVGEVFGCYKGGLTGAQHGWCILFGLIGWVWQLVLNLLARGPLALSEEEEMRPEFDDEPAEDKQ